MVKVTFLGTNGWFDSETGNTISILVETPDFHIVLDAGMGIHRLNRYNREDRPVYIFLSHFHLDHIAGLHTLCKNEFPHGLCFLVHEGGTGILNNFLNFPYSKPIRDFEFETRILEVPEQEGQLPFKAEFLPLIHASCCLGIRLELEGKVIAFCPDTGYCENAVTLARGADLVITECALGPGEVDESWPHLNPDFGARIAREAGARKLILTHFDAARYPDKASREQAEQVAQGLFPNSFASFDGMQVEI